MDSVIPTVGVLVFRGNEVLLVCHGRAAGHITGTYGLPAGRLRDGESERDAAVRELFEESGLTTDPVQLIELPEGYQAIIQRKDGVKTYSLKVFVARVVKGELLGNDEAAPEWVAFDRLDTVELLPNVLRAIQQGRTHLSV